MAEPSGAGSAGAEDIPEGGHQLAAPGEGEGGGENRAGFCEPDFQRLRQELLT
jgi:hypothetical protein